MVRYRTVRMFYKATVCALNGRHINHGWCYADFSTMDSAEEWARKLFREYNGIGSVQVYGCEMEFLGDGWHTKYPLRSESKVIGRDVPVALSTADLAMRCYDTTIMDYYEWVHPLRSDGSCQCGHHRSRYPVES